MKSGPESELLERYATRARQTFRQSGIDGPHLREWSESRKRDSSARRIEEAGRLSEGVPQGARLVCLDERGKDLDSRQFAAWLQRNLEAGARECTMIIGGADGLDESLRSQAGLVLGFGRMTLPHQLVRILAAEQLYRAATILSGHPYHRD